MIPAMLDRASPPWAARLLSGPALTSLVLGLLTAAPAALAQEEESSPSIELGSSRIGGPGLTDRERRRVRSWEEPEEYLTEENLPGPDSKKRLPSLHILAERYAGGQQWKKACRFYDMIREEFGDEGLAARGEGTDRGKMGAARAYLGCAEAAFVADEFDEVTARLDLAERMGLESGRVDFLRRKVLREQFRQKLGAGDLVSARKLYERYQRAGEPDEEERIWFGERLAEMAKQAKEMKDELSYRDAMAMLEEIAPLNTTYRALRADEAGDAALFRNIALVVGSAVGAVILLSALSRWRARPRTELGGGRRKKNPFLDDDDDLDL